MTKEIDGGSLGDYPNEKYRLFFEKFIEIETLDVASWKPIHILAFFCKKYQEQYGIKYQFKFNSPLPSKCFEMFHIKKLAILLSSNPSILKGYIDWVFENKVVKAKRRLTSISFMTNDVVVNDYKMNILLANNRGTNIDRATILPEKYKIIFQEAGITANNYGDLAFLFQMEKTSELNGIFEKLNSLGFDNSVLTRIV